MQLWIFQWTSHSPLLVAADLQEQWDALGLKYFRDVSTLATKEEIGNPDSTPAARPLQWYRYEREEGCSITVPSHTTCSLRRKTGAPGDSFGFIPLESVIERVCVVRIPRQVVAKRGSAVSFDATDPKDDDSTTRFVVNNLVGPPPEELLPVVPDEVMDSLRGDRAIADLARSLEDDVVAGRLVPGAAARRLLAAWRRN